MGSKSKKAIVITLGAALAGLLVGSAMLDNDWQTEKPQLLGTVWTVPDSEKDNTRLVTLSEEERTYRERIGVSSRRSMPSYRTVSYLRYHLESRRAPKGAVEKRTIIADIKESSGMVERPYIIGTVEGGIWIYNNGLELRDADTLEVRLTEDRIREANPALSSAMPDDTDKYKVSQPHQSLIFRSPQLEYYQIDALTGKITPADVEKLETVTPRNTASDGFTYVQPIGKARGATSVSSFLVSSFVTPTNFYYALLSEEQLSKVGKWPRGYDRPYEDEWRSLYRTPYVLDHRGQVEIDPNEMESVGDLKLLNSGFLQRAERAVWDVSEPSSSLILHKQDAEKNKPWHVGRLSREGELLWSVSTGLADLHSISDAENAAVFFGYQTFDGPTALRPGMLVFVNVKTGEVSTQNLTELPEELSDGGTPPRFSRAKK